MHDTILSNMITVSSDSGTEVHSTGRITPHLKGTSGQGRYLVDKWPHNGTDTATAYMVWKIKTTGC